MSIAQVLGQESGSSFTSLASPIVFVIDGDGAVREPLESLVRCEGWKPETCGSAQEFLNRPRTHVPTCLVVDAFLPDTNALDLQKRVACEHPSTSIIFIAARIDLATTVKAMKAGAVGIFIKPLNEKALLNGIREALERSRVTLAHEAETQELRDCYASLTPREREVMALVTAGLLNKQVGGELGICEGTVKAHRGQMMLKMKACSLADLVRIAARLGLADTRPEDKTGSAVAFSLLSSRNLKDRAEPGQSHSLARPSVFRVEESALR
jgi:FixJ family two-component response regulator